LDFAWRSSKIFRARQLLLGFYHKLGNTSNHQKRNFCAVAPPTTIYHLLRVCALFFPRELSSAIQNLLSAISPIFRNPAKKKCTLEFSHFLITNFLPHNISTQIIRFIPS
jgi:hypothetical protein